MSKCEMCGQKLPEKPKKPKIKVFKGTEEEWLKLATNVAFSYAPAIYHCVHCNHPVADGYCCGYCGSAEPGDADNEDCDNYF